MCTKAHIFKNCGLILDVDPNALLEHFRALKPTLLEHFRILKCTPAHKPDFRSFLYCTVPQHTAQNTSTQRHGQPAPTDI